MGCFDKKLITAYATQLTWTAFITFFDLNTRCFYLRGHGASSPPLIELPRYSDIRVHESFMIHLLEPLGMAEPFVPYEQFVDLYGRWVAFRVDYGSENVSYITWNDRL